MRCQKNGVRKMRVPGFALSRGVGCIIFLTRIFLTSSSRKNHAPPVNPAASGHKRGRAEIRGGGAGFPAQTGRYESSGGGEEALAGLLEESHSLPARDRGIWCKGLKPCLCVILLIHSCISPLEVLRSKCLDFTSSASAQSAPCSSSSFPSASRPYWSVGIQDGKARSPQEPVKAVRDGQPVQDPAGVRFSQEIIGRTVGPDGRDAVAQVRAEQARAVVRVG